MVLRQIEHARDVADVAYFRALDSESRIGRIGQADMRGDESAQQFCDHLHALRTPMSVGGEVLRTCMPRARERFRRVEYEDARAPEIVDERAIRRIVYHTRWLGVALNELLWVNAGLEWRRHDNQRDSARAEVASELRHRFTRIWMRPRLP